MIHDVPPIYKKKINTSNTFIQGMPSFYTPRLQPSGRRLPRENPAATPVMRRVDEESHACDRMTRAMQRISRSRRVGKKGIRTEGVRWANRCN